MTHMLAHNCGVSLHFHLALELDLAENVSADDLAVAGWLIGSGPPPATLPLGLSRLREPAADDGAPWLTGALARHAALPGRQAVRWSLALRTLMRDDGFYEAGLATIQWLGKRCDNSGWIGQAREEHDLLPSWTFLAHAGWVYVPHDGAVVGMDDNAPPPPAHWSHSIG